MSGTWEAADGTRWAIRDHFYHGRCCIELSRYPDGYEREKDPEISRVQIGCLYLSRKDVEVIYKMMLAESRPNGTD